MKNSILDINSIKNLLKSSKVKTFNTKKFSKLLNFYISFIKSIIFYFTFLSSCFIFIISTKN